jgi:hypothetical protein
MSSPAGKVARERKKQRKDGRAVCPSRAPVPFGSMRSTLFFFLSCNAALPRTHDRHPNIAPAKYTNKKTKEKEMYTPLCALWRAHGPTFGLATGPDAIRHIRKKMKAHPLHGQSKPRLLPIREKKAGKVVGPF